MGGVVRLFFALWPDPAIRHALLRARDALLAAHGGRAMHPDTLHLTLAFLGEVDAVQLDQVMAVGAGIRGETFDVSFDQAVCWRGNRIAHLETTVMPTALQALVAQLGTGLARAGLPCDRRIYLPHVTLVRNADCTKASPALPSVAWQARDFVLVRSSRHPEGARYEQLGRWPLL